MGKPTPPPLPGERATAEMPLEHLLGLRRRCRRTDEPYVLRSAELLEDEEDEHEG